MSANRKIRYYEEDDQGNRIPCTLELDNTLLKVAHYKDMSAVDHVARGRNEHRKKKVPLSPARQVARALGQWQVESIEENPIPGSEDLRVEYFEERRKMESRKGGCRGCDLNKLVRKYSEIMKAKGLYKQFGA